MFEFFEKLSEDEAKAFLQEFLKFGNLSFPEIAKQCALDGIQTDFSIKSIPPFMRWALGKLVTIPKKPDPALPQWIRDTESYQKRLFDFDEPSKDLILRAAYYLGESFVRSHANLQWGIGDPTIAHAKMPVVKGFKKRAELAPILVADNLFARVTAEPHKIGDFDRAVEIWNAKNS